MEKLLTYLLEGGGLALAARGLWIAFTWYIQQRNRQRTIQAVQGRNEISDTLKGLIEETPADYVQLMRIHNGGGDLEAGLPMYMSCVHEETSTGRNKLKGQIQGLELDDSYRNYLQQLIQQKDAAGSTKGIQDEFLRSLYQLMGAQFARSILLGINRKGIYFLRVTSQTAALDDANHSLRFRGAVSRLRRHYK